MKHLCLELSASRWLQRQSLYHTFDHHRQINPLNGQKQATLQDYAWPSNERPKKSGEGVLGVRHLSGKDSQ